MRFSHQNPYSKTVEKIIIGQMTKYSGTADIIIQPEETLSLQFINPEAANIYEDKFEFIIGAIQGSGIYRINNEESVGLTLFGINLDDMQKVNPINILEEDELRPFVGKKIVINSNTAEKYDLNIGSSIEYVKPVSRLLRWVMTQALSVRLC